MLQTRQRLIDGPDKDYLDEDEVAAYLHFSASTLRRLVKEGLFPKALEMTDQVRVWSWRDVLFWMLTVELRPRMQAETKVQPRSTKGQPASSGEATDSGS